MDLYDPEGRTIYYNICDNVTAIPHPACSQGGFLIPRPVYQLTADFQNCYYLSSSPETMKVELLDRQEPSIGFRVLYSGGDNSNCTTSKSFMMNFYCARGSADAHYFNSVIEDPRCTYRAYAQTMWACPVECPLNSFSLCTNHGSCVYDKNLKKPKCACNDGYFGDSCQLTTEKSKIPGITIAFIIVAVLLLVVQAIVIIVWLRIRSLRLHPEAYKTLMDQ